MWKRFWAWMGWTEKTRDYPDYCYNKHGEVDFK